MGRKPTKENYFTEKTENAIILYNNTQDRDERARIFSEHIYFPFYKLAENIIHTFKFYYTDVDDVEDLKHRIITMLLDEKIGKFNPSIGAKAYSYFGTIVKRWLINYNNKNYKLLKRRGALDEYTGYVEEPEEMAEESAIELKVYVDEYVKRMYSELDELFDRESDRKIADAILTIFATRTDLDIFKKKALYIYIREITNCKTPHLTYVISVLKREFYKEFYERLDQGTLRLP
jgi:hypothetical protein